MSIHLSFEQALAGLEKAVAAKGEDFKYEAPVVDEEEGLTMCMYFSRTGQPSCIVGHVLADHGVSVDDLGHWNEDATVHTLVDHSVLDVDARTTLLLRRAQEMQDNGHPWGKALAEAKAEVAP